MIFHLKNSLETMESVEYHNIEPTYTCAKKVVSPELAEALIELVDERGQKSDWAYNPDCLEYQIANPFARIRTDPDEKINACLPELFSLGERFLRILNSSFQNTLCDSVTGYHGFWVLKYLANGKFDKHCDWDSSYTGIAPPIVGSVCISLNDDYRGGETFLYDNQGNPQVVEREKYSSVLWDGWTQHKVAPVVEGARYVLVIHYTGIAK